MMWLGIAESATDGRGTGLCPPECPVRPHDRTASASCKHTYSTFTHSLHGPRGDQTASEGEGAKGSVSQDPYASSIYLESHSLDSSPSSPFPP